MREKSPSFYEVDESIIYKQDNNNTYSYNNSVVDTKIEASESTRKPDTKITKI